MSTYAEMSYDELSEIRDTLTMSRFEQVERVMREKSAVMTALVELAAEMDAEGLVVVPRRATDEMCAAGANYHDALHPEDQADIAWDVMIAAAPAPTVE